LSPFKLQNATNLAHRRAHSGCDLVCGASADARARSRKPFPGGPGAPVGRQKDRSVRSVLNARQLCDVPAKHRAAASCGNPVLGLSHRGDSRWRVPWRSAGRRARLSVRSRCRASGNWRNNAPFGASPPFFVFALLTLGCGAQSSGGRSCRENNIPCPGRSAARSGALQSRDLRGLGVRDDPGSATHHFVLRRARETISPPPHVCGGGGRPKGGGGGARPLS
jgi:hypothetical protein